MCSEGNTAAFCAMEMCICVFVCGFSVLGRAELGFNSVMFSAG